MSIRLVLLALALAIGSVGVIGQTVPRFESGPCAVTVPTAEKHVDCGYLTVPENRSKKNGRTIRLPIVILRSDDPNPKPDPVLKTLGGPGASSLRMIGARRASPWLRDRDYIIFEQRGTKYTEPALQCPEVDQAVSGSAFAHETHQIAKGRQIAASKKCYERLRSAGIDLDAYNSYENAADIEDLRRVLHLEKINLYGVSYSARLMLDVARYFPDGIRSVTIESTLAPEVNYDEVGVDGVVRSLNELFAACRTDADCNSAYPELEKEFYAVVGKLNKGRLEAKRSTPNRRDGTILLSGDDFATWIVDYLFSNEPSATVEAPSIIHRAFRGDYVDQFKRDGGPSVGGSFYSWGMRYSVWCSEERPFENTGLIRAQSEKYPGLKGYEVMALPDICSVWKVKPAERIANTPVVTDIPTLVLGAQYDAYTDPSWGKAIAGRLKKSFYYEVPWAGHGPGFSVPCVSLMIAAFIDDPGKAPPDDCIAKTRGQFHFLTKAP